MREGRPGAGNITIYNNGNGRPDGDYSTVEELTPPLLDDGTYEMLPSGVWGPEASPPCFIYDPPEEFYSPFISGAQRLENGNTLACAGNPGRVVEMTPDGEVVWEYINPVLPSGRLMQGTTLPCNPAGNNCSNKMFRAERYGSDHPAFAGRDLTPGEFLELYPACPGDLDGNGTVDGADLTLILGDWGPCCGCASDVNYDGEVNGADLTIILGTWGEC